MNSFHDLDDLASFKKIVTDHHTGFVGEVGVLSANVNVDAERLDVAHSIYMSNVQTFQVLLGGGDPDNYKRAASLLQALYASKVITEYSGSSDAEDAETGWNLRYSHADVQSDLNALKFYEIYHNEAAAFDLAFRCCDLYEDEVHSYDEDYAACICNYLKANKNLSVESFFMLFKSLMN